MISRICNLVIAALLSGAAVIFGLSHLAHAAGDPATAITAAGDAGWDIVTKDGPLWAALLIAQGLLRSFLSKQHWLAQGRVLAGLTGVSMVLAAALAWHFTGAPASGILTALFAGYTLITHPTVPDAAPKAKSGGAGTATMLAVLLLGGLAAGTATGCAASSRDTAINTASVAINAVASGELAYDRQHQDTLAVQGTPDQAAAALKVYRAKRAKFDKALSAAVDALIVAVKLNDQPSLDGLSAAVVEVITDYQALKGTK